MRNSEIKRIQKSDIIEIEGVHLIDIKTSKTGSGVRVVPLHHRVYDKIMEYSKKMDDNEPILEKQPAIIILRRIKNSPLVWGVRG